MNSFEPYSFLFSSLLTISIIVVDEDGPLVADLIRLRYNESRQVQELAEKAKANAKL